MTRKFPKYLNLLFLVFATKFSIKKKMLYIVLVHWKMSVLSFDYVIVRNMKEIEREKAYKNITCCMQFLKLPQGELFVHFLADEKLQFHVSRESTFERED